MDGTLGRLAALMTDDRTVELEPPRASLERFALSNKLEMTPVDSDVFDVVKTLKAIDPGLSMFADLRHDPPMYVLYWKGLAQDGSGQVVEQVVGAYLELDQRIVSLIRRIDAQGRGRHDLATELQRLEDRKDRENDHAFTEQLGPAAELLRHAIRKDLGASGSTVHMSGSAGGRKMRAERAARAKRTRR